MSRCPQCDFDGVDSFSQRLRLVQINPPPAFYDSQGRYHEHPATFEELYVCSKGHRWTVNRPGKRACRGCIEGTAVEEIPIFPSDGQHIDLNELAQKRADRQEEKELRNFFLVDADRLALDELLPIPQEAMDDPEQDAYQNKIIDGSGLNSLRELKAAYDKWKDEHRPIIEDLQEIVLDSGEIIAEGLETTNDLLAQFV